MSKHKGFSPLTLYKDGTDLDRIIAVSDIPNGVDEDDLVEYIEDVCSCNVKDIYFSEGFDHVALVKLIEPIEDISRCKRNISRRKLNRQVISVQLLYPPIGIVIIDLPCGLRSDMLESYFRSRDCGNTSNSPVSLKIYSQIAIITFKYPSKVLENILSRRHSPCGYSIDVEPYYHPFHDQIVSLLKNKRINDIDRGSSSEESSIDENYFYCNDDSNDLSDQSSSSEHSYNPRQPKIFSDDQQSDKSSDSSLESARDARQRKTRGCKLTRDYESVPINMDNICEHEEDKILLAKIFKDSVGESFKDYLERKHDCTIDIEFITKDGATNRNKNGATGRQTGSKKGQKVKSGLVASSQDQLRQANHLPIHVDFPQVRRILSANELAFLSIRSPISFSEPRKGSKSTAQDYRENIFQFGSSTISIKLGNITKEKAEVIVNVVGPDMDYNGNRITSSIVRAGGKSVAKMLDKHSGDAIFKTGSGNLPCDKIYTLTLDTYRGKRSQKIYRETIEECLNDARNDQIKSISFPIVGYGRAFKYPKTFVLETLVSQIILEIENPANKFLKNFTIVTSDEDIYDDLESILDQELSAKQRDCAVAVPHKSRLPSATTVNKPKLVGCKIVINGRKKDIDRLCGIIESSVMDQLLYSQTIKKSSPSCMPLRAKGHVLGYAAENKLVRITGSDSTSITLKGHRDTVKKLTNGIVSIMDTRDPSKICQDFALNPRFWKIIAKQDPQSPPYWSDIKPNTELTELLWQKKRFYRVDVDKATEKAVKTLVKKTWKKEYVGKGKDAINLSHENIRIKKVERIENVELFKKYAQKRLDYFRMLADEGQQKLLSLDKVKVQTQGVVWTQKHLPDILQQDIFPEINEHFLFHGTKPDLIETTIRSGLDSRLSSPNGLFGQGIYTAESSTKADQYTDSKTNRKKGDHQMLLVRMLLGKMYICSDPNPPKYRRPPCMNMECKKDNCIGGHDLHDSVVADGQWLFREFVVYSSDQCYPEFLITYERE